MSCFISYKDNDDDSPKSQKREQYIASNITNNSEEEENIDDDQSLSCSENIIENCINLMSDGESPFNILQIQYKESTPIFNVLFLETFLRYFDSQLQKDLELTYFIINGPVENATRLIMLDFFNILYTDLPNSFEIVHHLLSKTTSKGKIKFAETGGIYILCYFISNPENVLIIMQILSLISDQEIDYFNEILPPNAFFPINCNFDTTLIFNFKNIIKQLLTIDDLEILELLIQSLKNIFHKSDKAIRKLGNLIFKELFIKKQFLFEEATQLIPDLIEIFNMLCDQFDFEIFKLDLIAIFYSLLETNDYKKKVALIPSFLSLIDSIIVTMLPAVLESNTLNILEDMAFTENNNSFLPDIIETISDIASQIIMFKDECEYEEYLSECRGILDYLCDHEDSNISLLAKASILTIEDLNSNLDEDIQE